MWLDLEMTGLDPQRDAILQVAFGFTRLDLIDADAMDVTEVVISQPLDVLSRMKSDVREMHTVSGLMSKVMNATVSLARAEEIVLHAMRCQSPERTLVLAGNSIWVDRMFLLLQMPTVERYLHYQQIDVTSLKLLIRGWFDGWPPLAKRQDHTATADVFESLQELQHYKRLLDKLHGWSDH